MEEYYDKEYQLVKYEHFNDLLVYLDFGYLKRQVAMTLRPVQYVSDNKDGTYTIHSHCTMYTSQVVFKPGEEFTEIKPDGTKVQSLISIEGNKILHRQVEDNGRTLNHVYEFFPDKMTITSTAPGLKQVVKRHFVAVKLISL